MQHNAVRKSITQCEIMDSKFQVLAKKEDWVSGIISHLEIKKSSVQLEPVHAKKDEMVFPDVVPGGVAAGDNRLYVIDTVNDRIIIHELTAPCVPDHVFGSSGNQPYQFRNPADIAVYDELLYVADTGNNRIQVFYPELTLKTIWYGAGSGNGSGSGSGIGFDSPCDLAFDTEGNAYVADRGNKRIVRIGKDGSESVFCSSGDGKLSDPAAITVDDNGLVYIADASTKSILVYSETGFYAELHLDNFGTLKPFEPACLMYHDGGLFVGDARNRRLHRIDLSGSYEFAVRDVTQAPYRLTAHNNGNLYISFIDCERLFVLSKTAFRKTGYYCGIFDAKQNNCQWHRILFDADIPARSSLVISTFTSDDPILPDSLSLDSPGSSVDEWDSMTFTGGFAAGDMLIQNPAGRYLALKIGFEGDSTVSPVMHNLRVYYPRDTYLKYIPAIYQQDTESRDFLSRFLPILESVMLNIEDKIANSSRYYNPLAAPDEFVPWLASWLDFALDDKWPDEKKRRLILRASALYKERGTQEGLLDYIEIYSGYRPAIIELFKLRNDSNMEMLSHHVISFTRHSIPLRGYVLNESAVIGSSTVADEWELHRPGFADYAHRFIIFLYPVHLRDGITQRTVQTILDREKPAHTQYFCCAIKPMMRVGEQSMVGLDTIIAKDPDELVVGRSFTISEDSIINRKNAGAGFISGKRSNIGANVIT
jgi:phage tail-like protein